MFKPRKHQLQLESACRDIANGAKPKTIVLDCAPGSGKGNSPFIAAATLIPRAAKKVVVVVPRVPLREQCAEVFTRFDLRIHYQASLEIYETASVSDAIDPSKGTAGVCITYDALRNAGDMFFSWVARNECVVVLDEVHHCKVGGPTHVAAERLLECAKHRILASGSLERGDKCPIGFLPYVGTGNDAVVDTACEAFTWIRFGIAEAINAQAITDTVFEYSQGRAEWLDRDGVRRSVETLDDDSDAVWAALNSEYAAQLLSDCLEAFSGSRRNNPTGKMLVVCARITQAKQMLKFIRDRGGLRCDIATTADTAQCTKNVRRFKQGKMDVLVTVSVAYEGLDVPSITHIACLTNIRSAPWILQMVARAWRTDYSSQLSWDQQKAVVFVPDEPQMRRCLERIQGELKAAKLREEPGVESTGGDGPGSGDIAEITPLGSELTSSRVVGWSGEELSGVELSALRTTMKKWNLEHLTPFEAKQMLAELHENMRGGKDPEPGPQEKTSTPRVRIEALKTSIRDHVNAYAKRFGIDHADINKEIIRRFGKKRDDMLETDLKEVLRWLRQERPLRSAG